MIRAIVHTDKKWGIGKNNDMMFSLPKDMKFFRETTSGNVVVMGGNTLRSFPNGKPFYCSTKDGKLIHRLNKWGSSLTVSQFDKSGNQLSERYYAYGKLTRGADWDTASSVFTRFWWDENGQIRVYQYDFNGKVLDKYYFREGNKYIRYPLGNDMGEIDGPWKLEGQTIFIEGKEFYKPS